MASIAMDRVLGGALFITKGKWLVSAGDHVQEIHSTVSELRHQMRRDMRELLEAMQGLLAGIHIENEEDEDMDFDRNTEPVLFSLTWNLMNMSKPFSLAFTKTRRISNRSFRMQKTGR